MDKKRLTIVWGKVEYGKGSLSWLLRWEWKRHNVIYFEFTVRLLTRLAKCQNAVDFELGLFHALQVAVKNKIKCNIDLQWAQATPT